MYQAQHIFINPFEVQCLHQDLQARDAEIERLKAQLQEVLKPPQRSTSKWVITDEECRISDISCLYAFTVNAYFTTKSLRIRLSTKWNPDNQWQKDFLDEGHVWEFTDWPMLLDIIKDHISDPLVLRMVRNLPPQTCTHLNYCLNINSIFQKPNIIWGHERPNMQSAYSLSGMGKYPCTNVRKQQSWGETKPQRGNGPRIPLSFFVLTMSVICDISWGHHLWLR